MFAPTEFFDLSDPDVAVLFADCASVWDVIGRIAHHTTRLVGDTQTILGTVMDGAHIGDNPIYIAEGARIEPGVYVEGPTYIGRNATVRHGAYVRANVILLDGAILGHASEAKNALFLPKAAAPHFNYVGDSILGHHVNLGAGTKLSNLGVFSEKDPRTGQRPTIKITVDGREYDTGLAKFGAILGDDTQTGCNAVLNPGCIIGPRSLVYANTSLRKGFYSADRLIKLRQTIETAPRR